MQTPDHASVEGHKESELHNQIEELIQRSRAENQEKPVLARSYALEAAHLCKDVSRTKSTGADEFRSLYGRALLAESLGSMNSGSFASGAGSLAESVPILEQFQLHDDMMLAYEGMIRLGSMGLLEVDGEQYLQKILDLGYKLGEQKVKRKIAQLRGLHALQHGNYEEALSQLQTYEATLDGTGDDFERALMHTNYGIIYTRLGQTVIALGHHHKALELVEGRRDIGAGKAYGNLANTYFVLGDARALEYYTKSHEILLECGNKDAAAKALIGISNSYEDLGKFDDSLQALKQARILLEEVGDREGLALVLINESNLHKNDHSHAAQLNCTRRAFELSVEFNNERINAYARLALAIALTDNDMYAEAMQECSQALLLLRKSGDQANILRAMVLHGEVLGAIGQGLQAIQVLLEAKELAKGQGAKRQYVEALQALANQHRSAEEWRESNMYLEEYTKELLVLQKEETARRVENIRILQRAESERQEAELERRRSAELTVALNRVSELNQRVREKNIDLERLNAEKNEFLGIAAHDLRSPLNNIRMLADMIVNNSATAGHKQSGEHAADILIVAEQMLGMVNQLLDVNRIESGQIDPVFQAVEWNTLLHKIVSQYRSAAERKNIGLHLDLVDQIVIVNVDPNFLEQVIDNLVSNAVKYSYLSGNVHLRLSITRNMARFSVADSGPGISAHELPRLFERFQNISTSPSAGEHSVGLGLSIVHKLVILMGGRVWCESIEGHGATFFVEFPLHIHED